MQDEAPSSAALVSASEASRLLGIKRSTLYAYASRRLVRSERASSSRERLYSREDLERLKARRDARAGHGAVAAGALRWGEPVLESAITAIDPVRGPRYRGHWAVELASRAPFESVAELLWTGALPAAPPTWRVHGADAPLAPLAGLVPAGGSALSALGLALPVLAARDFERLGGAEEEELFRARRLVRRMAALAGLGGGTARVREALKEPSVARGLLVALGARPSPRAESAMNLALVLVADHELNASSFTARVAASAGADLYACVSAGLATLSGPRHGGIVPRVEALLAEIGRPERARAVLQDRARRGDDVPGFGHPLYPEGDPRATPLLAAATEIAPKSRRLAALRALLEAMRDAGRARPTVDLAVAAIVVALKLDRGAGTGLFAVGRTAGLVAHALEQRRAGFLLRPRARYVGP